MLILVQLPTPEMLRTFMNSARYVPGVNFQRLATVQALYILCAINMLLL